MADVVGIRFKRTGKMYYFDPSGIDLDVNDYVVVKTARGMEMGQVVVAPRQVLDSEVKEPLKPVVRKAEPEDIKHAEELEQKTAEALAECGKWIEKLELPMKLLAAEYSLTGNRLTFFFSASERVDFRELVKELSSRLKVRVELRQVGPRDGAKLIGGYGRCGRQLCCCSFLTEFEPVSIRMAKDQDLPLNPMKISGICGRLMCCLGYEGELYRAMREKLPKKGQRVMTNSGAAVVTGNNPLKQTVLVELKSGAIVELLADEVTIEAEQPPKQQKKKG
ncbi:MAG: stage 0 sporulation family protein [Dehalococcoidales bacterium]|nr:stage 0 sporulation family protein [Dehalococcoidales bacterium]